MKLSDVCSKKLADHVGRWESSVGSGGEKLFTLSKGYWDYRQMWPSVHQNYQTLVGKLPDRFRLSRVYLGAEIETENIDIKPELRDMDTTPPGWFTHQDGSLRAGLEFVTKPLTFDDMMLAMANLTQWFKISLRRPPSFTWRTSNHVHLNVRDMTFEDIGKLLLLYSIFELQMFQYAGMSRLNSVFCVPLTKTNLHNCIHELLANGAIAHITRDGGWDKYCAVGTFRLYDLGTLEFRHFPGGFDTDRLATWISFILSLRVAASTISWPVLEHYIKNLNTLCNYRELQVLVFGQDLADALGTPESSVQMLSNGVTFAKKCLVPSRTGSPLTGSAMSQFMVGLRASQDVLCKDYKEEPIAKKAPRSTFGMTPDQIAHYSANIQNVWIGPTETNATTPQYDNWVDAPPQASTEEEEITIAPGPAPTGFHF